MMVRLPPAPRSRRLFSDWGISLFLELSCDATSLRCMKEQKIEKTPTEARQAVKVWPMKYVLGIGMIGAAVGLLLAWLVFGA